MRFLFFHKAMEITVATPKIHMSLKSIRTYKIFYIMMICWIMRFFRTLILQHPGKLIFSISRL